MASDLALLELEEEVDLSLYPPVCLKGPISGTSQTEALALGQSCEELSQMMILMKIIQVGVLLLAG